MANHSILPYDAYQQMVSAQLIYWENITAFQKLEIISHEQFLLFYHAAVLHIWFTTWSK